MLTLSGLDYHSTPSSLPFDDIKSCKQAAVKRKELTHSASSNEFTSMPVQASTINSSSSGSGSVESGSVVSTNCVAQKAEFMVLDLRDLDVSDNGRERRGSTGGSVSVTNNVTTANSASVDSGLNAPTHGDRDKCAGEANGTQDEGVELEVLQRAELTTRVQNYTSRATLEVGHGESKKSSQNSSSATMETGGEVDTTVTFPLEIMPCTEKTISTATVNGVEQNSLQLRSSYTSVKSIMNSTSPNSGMREDKSGASKGSEIAKHSAGSEAVGKAAPVAVSPANTASAVHSMYSMQHLSVLSLPPTSWPLAPVTSEKHENYCGLTTWYADFRTVKRSSREDVNRLTFHGSAKDSSGEVKNKSLDENGNAVNRLESGNSNSTERKGKQRKTKTNNDRNVIMSQNIEGHRGDKDIDTLLKFIESNSDSKGTNKTKNATSHSNGPMNFSSKQQRNCSRLIGSGTKPRRDRGSEEPCADDDRMGKGRTGAGKQVGKEHRGKGSKLKKSNSLEEISKTKLEDLTSNPKDREGGAGSVNNGEEGNASVLVRRPQKQSTLDNGEFYSEKTRVGDRRSWGTEEGQLYYCSEGITVSADESSGGSAQSNRKKKGNQGSNNLSSDDKRRSDREEGVSVTSLSAASGASEDTEFLVVTKKQRRKKRRSSSGGRGTSASTGGSIFGDDNFRPSYNNYNPSYYQNRDNGGSSYYQRKTFSHTSGGFPPHDRTVERESGMWCDPYRHRPRSPEHLRRKSTSSMPPSDKSDSSDLDSVHSLPVSSTTPKLTLDQTSTSSGSTPQASYADIARMASTNVVSSNPAHSNNYVNINLNSGRWPAMGAPKSSVSAATPSNPVAVPAVTTSAPNVSSSSAVVSMPVVSSNPQFITGPKLNIGAPPVSGSKVAVVSANHPLSGPSHTSSATIPPSSIVGVEEPSQSSKRKDSETLHLPSEPTSVSKTHASPSPPSDIRTKKDAMTNTNLDYNTVSQSSSEENNLKPYHHSTSPKPAEAPVNLLLDGEYPSLEESLVVDKSKNAKSSHLHTTHLSSTSPLDTIVSPGPIIANDPSKESNSPIQPAVVLSSSEKEKRLPILAAGAKVEAQTSQELCVPESVIARTSEVPSCDAVADTCRLRDVSGKTKSLIKKNSNAGSRPPVIILNENVPEACSGVSIASDLTFGFEVNEQLLMYEYPEKGERPSVGTQSSEDISATTTAVDDKSIPSSSPSSPPVAACSSIGEDFSARYREPPTQPDNHDKIVTFVGLAWDDVLNEMNCLPVHSGGKVQYYSGQ